MKWYWIILIILTSIFAGMVFYSVIDDVVDANHNEGFFWLGVEVGCGTYNVNNTVIEIYDCFDRSVETFEYFFD